jgi:glycosyltransferase involved in cell wall biosynthesis
LRRTQPLALTPAGQRQLLHWLLKGGKEAYRLRDEEIWWFLFECAEDPSRGIAATYLLHADWQQRFPCGLTVFGRDALLQWIRRRYGISDEWLNQADLSAIYHPVDELRLWHATQPDVHAVAPRAFVESADTARLVDWLRRHEQRWPLTPAWWERLEAGLAEGLAERPGVNVVGYFCYPSGQAEAARFTVQSLQQVGIRTSCRDHPNGIDRSLPGRAAYLGQELFPYTILHLAPDAPVRRAYPLSNLAPRPGVYRIAVWYWELETAPAHWRRQARWVHEVWAPTRFIAEALRRIMPVPVVDMLPAVELSSHVPRPRRYFNLPDDCFLFLFLFDMCSVMERKNPLGLIRAFQQAFAPTDHAHLAIKVTRGDADPASLARLHEAAERAGVTVLDRLLTREDSYALLDCADCYVSLHRSEGFGLTMAESMLLGKPVIATGYSGNLDFMTRENSLLVDYRRVPITTKLPIYPRGAFWAEPSVEEAARLMRWVFEHPAAARNLGARAKAEVSRLLSPQSAGERMARRLRELH